MTTFPNLFENASRDYVLAAAAKLWLEISWHLPHEKTPEEHAEDANKAWHLDEKDPRAFPRNSSFLERQSATLADLAEAIRPLATEHPEAGRYILRLYDCTYTYSPSQERGITTINCTHDYPMDIKGAWAAHHKKAHDAPGEMTRRGNPDQDASFVAVVDITTGHVALDAEGRVLQPGNPLSSYADPRRPFRQAHRRDDYAQDDTQMTYKAQRRLILEGKGHFAPLDLDNPDQHPIGR